MPAQQVRQVQSPELALTWPFAELDAPNLSLGAEQAAICRVAPGPHHLAHLLIKGKINDPGLVAPLPVLGSGWLSLSWEGLPLLRGMVARKEETHPEQRLGGERAKPSGKLG